MATFSGNGSINSSYVLDLNVNETSVSQSGNYSTISWSLVLRSTTYYSFAEIGSTCKVNLNGEEVYNAYSQKAISAGQSITIASGTKNIPHNADGTKILACSASYTQSSTASYTPGNISASGNLTLTNIDVTPSFTTNPSVTSKTEETITVNRGITNISSNFYWSLNNSTWTKFTTATTTITGLSPNTAYTIYIQARNINNANYKVDKQLSVTTYNYPTQSVASKTENRITMNWAAESAIGLVAYRIDDGEFIIVGTANASSGSYTIQNLNPSTTYKIQTYLVRNSNNTQTQTASSNVKTYAVPTQSLNFKAQTGIKMNWNIDSTADRLWYSTDNGSTWSNAITVNGTSGNYTISGLTANTTYTIKTRLRRAATQTTYDTTALSVKTYALPTQSVASKTETTITMNWALDSEANKLYYSTNGGSTWSEQITVSGTNGTYTITGLNADTTYNVLLKLHRAVTDSDTQPSTYTTVTTYQYPYITGIEKDVLVIGESQTITIYNPLNREVTVTAKKDRIDGTVLLVGTTTGTTSTFTMASNTLYSTIPNSQSGTVLYYVKYNEQVITTRTGTYRIRGDEKPTFTNFTYEDTDTKTLPLTGNNQIIVGQISDVKVTVSVANKATGKNSATISKYRVVIGNLSAEMEYSSSETVFTTLNNVKNATISVTAVDSRGLETTVYKTAIYKDYKYVNFTKTKIERENGIGTTAFFDVNGTYWDGNFGSTDNSFTKMYYRYKISTSSTYSDWIEITDRFSYADGEYSSNSNAFLPTTDNGITPVNFEVGKEYNIQFTAQDAFYWYISINSTPITLGSGIPCTDKYKDSNGNYHIGINQLGDGNVGLAITGGLKVDGYKLQDYSATEIKIGTWYNSNLYRKIMTVDVLTAHSSDAYIAHNISNLNLITNFYGVFQRSNNAGFLPINYYESDSYYTRVKINSTNLIIRNVGFVGTMRIIIEYTKTS